jgi:hypothetical protein
MIANAMFHGQDISSKILIGPIMFSLTGIYISLISALFAASPVLLVTYLFRNARHRPVSKMAAITKNRNFFKWPKLLYFKPESAKI